MKGIKRKAEEIGDSKNKAIICNTTETPRKRARRKRKIILGLKRKRLNFYTIERNVRSHQDPSYNQINGEELLDKESSMLGYSVPHHLATNWNDNSYIERLKDKIFQPEDLNDKSLKDYKNVSVCELVDKTKSPHTQARRKRKEIISAKHYNRYKKQGGAQTSHQRLVLRAENRRQHRRNTRAQMTAEQMAMERLYKRQTKRDYRAQMSEEQRAIMRERCQERYLAFVKKHKQISRQHQTNGRSQLTNGHDMESVEVDGYGQMMTQMEPCHQSSINTNFPDTTNHQLNLSDIDDATMREKQLTARKKLRESFESFIEVPVNEVKQLWASNNYKADNGQSSDMHNIHSSIGHLIEVPVVEVGSIYELEDILRRFRSCNYHASFMADQSTCDDNQLAYAVERRLNACQDGDNEHVAERIVPQRSAFHNVARNYFDNRNMHCFRLSNAKICIYCGAKLFYRESNEICCQKGKIRLPSIHSPPELLQIFKDGTELGMHFRRHIRSYNNAFAFTSIGVTIDKQLANGMMGVYTFRAQGSIYHKIGSLIPNQDARPRYIQMYIYDTDHEIENRILENDVMKREILEKLKKVLDQYNPYVHVLRQLSQRDDLQNCKLILKERAQNEHQYNLPTASQVAAIWVHGDNPYETHDREIVVETKSNRLFNVRDVTGFYDPLQYPLLLPYGSHGWDLYRYNNLGRRIFCREYYSYILQIRNGESSLFLLGGRLLQQYVVDNYVKIATQKLLWIRNHQNDIRAEMYQGLQDALNAGEYNGDNVGRRTILPASYVGSPRDMYKRYQDAMALVHKYGKPDLFITMTCNPSWDEITNELLPGQLAQDRPDLTTRIFRARFEELKKDLFERGILGKVIAHVHVVEFQKRGLPHAHILLILDNRDKITSPDDYDQIVRAEIPDCEVESQLHDIVKRHMIHGPCGNLRRNSSCMKNGRCKKNYPKEFSATTFQGNNSYPIYRRRDDGRQLCLRENTNLFLDNRWVVPYNPWLLKKYNCHINVEICSSIVSIKYLYKYVYKGPDHVCLQVRIGDENDEISQFVNARWICPHEAFWKLFSFPLNKIYPSVIALQVHLPNRQQVYYNCHRTIDDVIGNDRSHKTMLTEFFKTNAEDIDAQRYLFREFPEHYKWVSSARKWVKRRTQHATYS